MPLAEPSDGEIVRQVLAGEVDAFATLIARYRDRMMRYATHMLGDSDEAEDVLQDAFVRAYRALPRCAEPDRFNAWLFRIVVNRCRTAGARRMRRARTVVTDEAAMARAAARSATPAAEWLDEVDRAVQRLEPDQREAFLLRHVDGMGYAEMTAVTGVGESALKMRVKRACDRLRVLLKEWEHV
ncbi:MAG: RNA polymerase sigma factor [Gemmatimonadales bacterium]